MVVGGGSFYGTTFGCGKYGYGTVFTLAPDGSESLFYSFKGGRDGFNPDAGLIIDAQGNLYGTTDYGGKVSACTNGAGGCGTVFRLAPNGTKTVLYKFKGSPGDGYLPQGNVIMDASGILYGTLFWGGLAGCDSNRGCGAVFKLAPDRSETVLHFFKGGRSDGANPPAGLVADAAGNLFGTTLQGEAAVPAKTDAERCSRLRKTEQKLFFTSSRNQRTAQIRWAVSSPTLRAISTAPPTRAGSTATAPCSRSRRDDLPITHFIADPSFADG